MLIAAALKPLKAMIYALSGEQYVTISVAIPLLSHIYSTMEHEVGDTDMTDEIKECIVEDLKTWYIDPDVAQLLELFHHSWTLVSNLYMSLTRMIF